MVTSICHHEFNNKKSGMIRIFLFTYKKNRHNGKTCKLILKFVTI